MKNAFLILVSLVFFCCSSNDASSTGQYDLKIHKIRIIDFNNCLKIVDNGNELCVTSVNDSRCPFGGECIWEGDAVVRFSLITHAETKTFSLHTNKKFRQDTLINNLNIKLLDVFPYPELNDAIPQNAYSVEVSISEN